MKKDSYKKNNIKLVFSLIMSIVLITTTLSSISVSSLNSEHISNDLLKYEFAFQKPEIKKFTVSDLEFSKIHMKGTNNIGKAQGNPRYRGR